MSLVDRPAAAIARRVVRCVFALVLVLPGGFATAGIAAESGSRVELSGHVLPALAESPGIAREAGAADPGEALTLTVVLKRSDEAGFQRHLAELYDARSPDFHRFSDPVALADRFGPDAGAYAAVRAYFAGQGFAIVEDSANRLTLTVRGTRAAAERALAVHIADFSLGERTFHANLDEPSLPSEIGAHVQAIAGLSDLAQPTPNSFALPVIEAICALQALLPIATAPGYVPPTPKQLFDECVVALRNLNIYWNPPGSGSLAAPRQPRGDGGSGQTIGLVEFDSYLTSDVRDFLEIAGFPASQIDRVSNVHVNGGAERGANENEVLLDIDTVLAVAPGADIVVYDAPFAGSTSFQTMFNAMINGGVSIISNSWAYCEDQTSAADVQSIDSILQTAAAAGISVFNGSGDSGSTCLDGSANTIGVPADSPHGTAVGGTSANTAAGYIYAGETWWSSAGASPPGGEGGFGVSRYFSRPAFQNGFTSATMRSVPDVAINADPATVGVMICQASAGGCPSGLLYGGTSFAAPLWAALHARLVEALGEDIGDANQALYPLAETAAFHDAASMGSDFAHVGLGSADFGRLHLALAGGTAGAVDAGASNVTVYMTPALVSSPGFSGIPADGTTSASVVVTLRDADGNLVGGKTVSLSGSAGSHVAIAPPNAVTSPLNGSAVFTIRDATPESFVLTASDTSDGIVIAETADAVFAVPSAASAGILAFPTTVPADGVSTSSITVTLRDAQDRPTPGKTIVLAQDGRAIVTGPTPPVTDANGSVVFTASDPIEETVTFTAVDHTDGDLPVPGTAVVTFSGSAAGSCVAPPVGLGDYLLGSYVNGFAAYPFFFGNTNFGCSGAGDPAFDTEGNAYVPHLPTGDLYKIGPGGGVATTPLSNLGPTLRELVFAPDGRLYGAHSVTTGDFTTGNIIEIDPETGAQLRVLASNLTCPHGLSFDPLSGDLFFDDNCTGAGSDNPAVFRMANPGGASPTISVYTNLPGTPNGHLSFAPDGTLYAATVYGDCQHSPLIAISGTDQPMPPTQTTLEGVDSCYWLRVGAVDPDGSARSLLVFDYDAGTSTFFLNLVDIKANPPTGSPIAQNLGSGTIGADGCLYTTALDTVFRITPSDGVCDFSATNPAPALSLSPPNVTPDPTQGGSVALTATIRNVIAPSGAAVFFEVRGANAQTRLVRSNAAGVATFAYQGLHAGDDIVTASVTLGAEMLTSNVARIHWGTGPHASLVSLNGPFAATATTPVALSATLVDVTTDPSAPIAGAPVHFAVGGASCDGVVAANGVATCSVTIAHPGIYTLVASYAGNAQHLPASASALLVVPTDGIDLIFADGFDGAD